MFWVFVFIVVVAAVSFAISKQRNAGVAVQAEYERIRRTEPDSALASLGPNEFEIAFKKAVQRQKAIRRTLTFQALPVLIGGAVGGMLVGMLIFGFDEEGTGGGVLLMFAGVAAATFWMFKREKEKLPSVIDIMREQVAA